MKRCFSVQTSLRNEREKGQENLQVSVFHSSPPLPACLVSQNTVGGWVFDHLRPLVKNGQAFRCTIPPSWSFSVATSALPPSLSHQVPCHGLLSLVRVTAVNFIKKQSAISSGDGNRFTMKMWGSRGVHRAPHSRVGFTQNKAAFSCPELSAHSEAQGVSLLSLTIVVSSQVLPSALSVQPCCSPGAFRTYKLTGTEGICKGFSKGKAWEGWTHGILHQLQNILLLLLLLLLSRTQMCWLNFWGGTKYSEGNYQLK